MVAKDGRLTCKRPECKTLHTDLTMGEWPSEAEVKDCFITKQGDCCDVCFLPILKDEIRYYVVRRSGPYLEAHGHTDCFRKAGYLW